MMKIAIEAQRLFREKKHGMDIVALQLIRALQKADTVNEYFILVKPDKDNGVISETKNFHIVEVPSAPYPIWEQFYLPREIKRIKPDVLHCTSNTAPLFTKTKLVLTLHDILYMEKIDFTRGTWYQRLGNLYRKIVVPRIVGRCHKVITVSDFEKKEIEDYFGFHPSSEKVRTIYNAQNPGFTQVTDTAALQLFKQKYALPDQFILYLGNTHPNKNLKNTLKALHLLHLKGETTYKLVMPDIDLGFLTRSLNEIKAPELRTAIHLTGYVPNQELVYLYNLATLFLYPSFYESFGIPILEAMSCGTPVITSNCTAMSEVAGGAAELIDPRDPEDLVKAIQRVLNDELLYAKYKKEGLQRAASFKWSIAAKEVLSVYNQVSAPELSLNHSLSTI